MEDSIACLNSSSIWGILRWRVTIQEEMETMPKWNAGLELVIRYSIIRIKRNK